MQVAPVIAQYTHSLKAVLDIFRNLLDEHGPETGSNLGYHTDEQEEDEQVLQLETNGDVDVELPPPSPMTSQQVTEAESDDNISGEIWDDLLGITFTMPLKKNKKKLVLQARPTEMLLIDFFFQYCWNQVHQNVRNIFHFWFFFSL